MSAPVVMVQGTASSVGKSVITAGLCRILRRRGLRVAPFKAQNMSLNAAVTLDGGEIARSTAVQAAAAGIEPTVDMNPILLKPEADARSQVIVRGKVWGTQRARDYFTRKLDFWPVVAEALDHLRASYDVIVAEGAGSPAEMNLRDRDIVNMRVARYAEAAVILVGDIDRGGVFAQLIGTLNLLPPEERQLVRGLVVNRFRGDPALFVDGVQFLEERTSLPVFGVVPAVRDLALAEEDAAPLDRREYSPSSKGFDSSDRDVPFSIAVIRLPRIANFDDFGPLERLVGVNVSYVDRPEQLVDVDLVILPGSKSTIADLAFVRERGLAEAILAAHLRGVPIVGICGGYQMLGSFIDDPERIESPTGGAPGLGLLPHSTVFRSQKQTSRVRARLTGTVGPFAAIQGAEIEGYEIHAGRTSAEAVGTAPLQIIARAGSAVGEPDGMLSDDGLLFGTYLHGLFANPAVTQSLLAWLQARASKARGEGHSRPETSPPTLSSTSKETHISTDPYDRWADTLEASLDVPLLLDRCGLTHAWRQNE